MNVIESFTQIFDKIKVSSFDDVWTVTESKEKASFKRINIKNKGNKFCAISNETYGQWKLLFQSRSTFLKDLDCDGVACCSIKDEIYFILVELKSTLSSSKITSAVKQIVFTYLKLFMLFSLCEGFDSHIKLIGVIGCKPPKDEQQFSFLKENLMLMTNGVELQPDVKCLLKLYFNDVTTLKLGDISFLSNVNLNNTIRDKEISLYLKVGDKYEDEEALFDLQKDL